MCEITEHSIRSCSSNCVGRDCCIPHRIPFGALDATESHMDSGFLITSTEKSKYKSLDFVLYGLMSFRYENKCQMFVGFSKHGFLKYCGSELLAVLIGVLLIFS